MDPFWTAIDHVTQMIALGGVSICGLSLVILGVINQWGILDPRTGSQVKGGLIKTMISGALFGLGGGIPALALALSGK
jgi:hypothetical protein